TASQEAWPGAERNGRKPAGESRSGTPTGERPRVGALRPWRGSSMDAPAGVPLPFLGGVDRSPEPALTIRRTSADRAARWGFAIVLHQNSGAPRRENDE